MNNTPVLECHQLCKEFRIGSEVIDILRGVDLQLYHGDTMAVLGSSGAGKTTLLSVLGGLEKPTSGSVKLLGNQLSSGSDLQRTRLRNKHLGFVYQLHHLLQEFSACENVQIPVMLTGVSVKEAKEKALAILEKVGMTHRHKHKPAELSGGERQRVAIARALVNDPACILLDEPTGNLDRQNAERIIDLLMQLSTSMQTGIVIVTHDKSIALQTQRQMELVDGKLVPATL